MTCRLEPGSEGTRLHFEHSGFDLSDPGQEGAYRGLQGWNPALDVSLRREIEAFAAAQG